ncbi:MAG: type II toxin-antitoxin system VapC family toxin [Actinomycetota bacterium]
MILVDANLLLYAYNSRSPQHDAAREWLEDVLSGEEEVGFALVTLLAFLRLATSQTLLRTPFTPAEAIAVVRAWLASPNARLIGPTEFHWSTLDEVCRTGQARGPLLMDAHLAALALEHGATLCTTDRDFARFPRLRVVDPIAD